MKNLNELKAKQAELQYTVDKGIDNPFSSVTGVLNKFMNNKSNASSYSNVNKNPLLEKGVKAALTLVSSTIVSRFKLGLVPKLILTTGVAIATPYVVDKVYEIIQAKNNKKF